MGYNVSLNKMAFVGLTKASNKGCHRVLLFKIEQNDICGD